MNLELIASGIDVSKIYWNILENPQLWNEYTTRTESDLSPHYGLDDIWVRFGEKERSIDGNPHDSIWYPSSEILGVKDICLDIMRLVEGVELGGVLITRIKAGKECKPHIDNGWHAKRYEKFALQIASAPNQSFHVESEKLESKPGDLYIFDNSFVHWVINDSQVDRITMIVCIRRN